MARIVEFQIDDVNGPRLLMQDSDETLHALKLLNGRLTIGEVVESPVRTINVCFTQNNKHYVNVNQKNSYTTIGLVAYDGSTVSGAIASVKVVAKIQTGNGKSSSFDIRLVNGNNGDVIASKTGMDSTGFEIITLEDIGNVPTSATILELQAKGTCQIANLAITF